MPKFNSSTCQIFENMKNYKVYGVLAATSVLSGSGDAYTYGLSVGMSFGVMTVTNLSASKWPDDKSKAKEIVDKVNEEVLRSTFSGYGQALILGSILLAFSTLDWQKGNGYLGNGLKIMLDTFAGALTGVLYGATGTVLAGLANNKLSDLKQSALFARLFVKKESTAKTPAPLLRESPVRRVGK